MKPYGPRREKPVFGVSDKASFKLVSSATETSLHMILSKKRITGADQTAGMRRLVCAFVVRKPGKDRFCRYEAHILCKQYFRARSTSFLRKISNRLELKKTTVGLLESLNKPCI